MKWWSMDPFGSLGSISDMKGRGGRNSTDMSVFSEVSYENRSRVLSEEIVENS